MCHKMQFAWIQKVTAPSFTPVPLHAGKQQHLCVQILPGKSLQILPSAQA